jgi:hypothetical protein
MKRQVRYRVMTITGKLNLEIRLIVDDSRISRFGGNESTFNANGDIYTSLNLFPIISLNIVRRSQVTEEGQIQRPAFNPNDSLGMSRYHLPVFLSELEKAFESLKVPDMYSYVSKRLTVNEELAERHRRVFSIGMTVVEMTPVVISQPDETKVEGIKLKFNNEESTVLLTINDIEALLFTLRTMEIDTIVLTMHMEYLRTGSSNIDPSKVPSINRGPIVDIVPKDTDEL